MPAPIILFTYNRILHAEQAIRSLAANDLAKDSELFVFSDGPKDETERPIIEEIRHLIRETKGFKDIHLIERSENWGLARNVIDGVTSLVNLYGEVIVVE
ncbi:MAG: glycosyltransferase, partial [Paraprevotella sp.]|nr:glycosyltransferase [Paraprevotella sp.]